MPALIAVRNAALVGIIPPQCRQYSLQEQTNPIRGKELGMSEQEQISGDGRETPLDRRSALKRIANMSALAAVGLAGLKCDQPTEPDTDNGSYTSGGVYKSSYTSCYSSKYASGGYSSSYRSGYYSQYCDGRGSLYYYSYRCSYRYRDYSSSYNSGGYSSAYKSACYTSTYTSSVSSGEEEY